MTGPLSLAVPRTRRATRRQHRGFSLLEVSLVLVLTGVLMAIALKSQEMVEQYRQAQFVNQVRTLVSSLQTYRQTNGRWPGDCNRDGLLDEPLRDSSLMVPELLDYAVPPSYTAAPSASSTYTLGLVCPGSTLDPFEDANVVFNELKLGGLIPSGQPNRLAASHPLGGHAFPGRFTTLPEATALLEDQFNAVVLPNISISTAKKLAVAVDGFDGSAANLNRVRRTSDMQTFEPMWTKDGESESSRITTVLFFDRVPPLVSP